MDEDHLFVGPGPKFMPKNHPFFTLERLISIVEVNFQSEAESAILT